MNNNRTSARTTNAPKIRYVYVRLLQIVVVDVIKIGEIDNSKLLFSLINLTNLPNNSISFDSSETCLSEIHSNVTRLIYSIRLSDDLQSK